jgi:hypothetical protein
MLNLFKKQTARTTASLALSFSHASENIGQGMPMGFSRN